jgi:ATP synthase I subunit
MAPNPPDTQASRAAGHPTERRIGWLTPIFGVLAALAAYLTHHPRFAVGLILGSALAWLNFRWLRKGLDALVAGFVVQAGQAKPQVPLWTYLAAALRYGLLASAVYVIFVYLHVPLVSLILGLCALAVAAILASVWEILNPAD